MDCLHSNNCAKLLMYSRYLHFSDLTLTCQTHHDSAVQHLSTYMYCYLLPWNTFTQKTGLSQCQTHYDSINITCMMCIAMYCHGLPAFLRPDVKLMTVSVNMTSVVCIVMYSHGPPSVKGQYNVLPWTSCIPQT